MATSLPQRRLLPEVAPTDALIGTPAQQAFRLAIREVEDLRTQLQQLRASQATTRQAYWRQVGPVAAATVVARRALYEPLETALSGGFLSRAEEQQVLNLLVHNAHSLQNRFGEDESAILARHAPTPAPVAAAPEPVPTPSTTASSLPPHEQAAAAARARRHQHAQAAREAQAQAANSEGQALLQNTKTAYRQLARLHHPDRAAQADATIQQAQTALMQRITAAYAAGDLAALLTLLADEEAKPGVHPTPPTPETEELLRRYTQALAQQQQQLRQELATAQRPLDDTPWSGTEKQQKARLRQIKRDLRAEIDYLTRVAHHVQEPTSLRLLLRELASQHRSVI
jgi:hypothetical protein